MKIYTKTGDDGKTSLLTGERLDKDEPRIATYGTIDELNSVLGMARAFSDVIEVREKILQLQKVLPRLMADLASMNRPALITETDVKTLEEEMDEMDKLLPPLRSFLTPGSTKSGAIIDLARTVTRRAERLFCKMSRFEAVHEVDGLFLNRLSDYCFMLMRVEEYVIARRATTPV